MTGATPGASGPGPSGGGAPAEGAADPGTAGPRAPGPLRAGALLAREAFADALGRRLALALAARLALGVLVVSRCTTAMTGTIQVDERTLELEELGFAVGIPLFGGLALALPGIAALLVADAVAAPLRTGEAGLWLARPVARATYALARGAGFLGVALVVAIVLLGASAGVLHLRQGLPLLPALQATAACALGVVTAGALAAALALWLPRVAAVLGVWIGIAWAAGADVATLAGARPDGLAGAAADYGPALLATVVHAVGAWGPEVELGGDPAVLWLRLVLWAVAATAALALSFARREL